MRFSWRSAGLDGGERRTLRGGPRGGPILVVVDGSPESRRALEWAVVRASAGGSPLRIVHAYRLPVSFDACGWVHGWDLELFAWAHRVLDDATRHAHDLAPDLPVSTCVHARRPLGALVIECRAAELIVLGRGRGGWWDRTRGVDATLARRARGRVVIVGPDDETLL